MWGKTWTSLVLYLHLSLLNNANHLFNIDHLIVNLNTATLLVFLEVILSVYTLIFQVFENQHTESGNPKCLVKLQLKILPLSWKSLYQHEA